MKLCCILIEHYKDMFIAIEDMKEVYLTFVYVVNVPPRYYNHVTMLKNTILGLLYSILDVIGTRCIPCSNCLEDVTYYRDKYHGLLMQML